MRSNFNNIAAENIDGIKRELNWCVRERGEELAKQRTGEREKELARLKEQGEEEEGRGR